MLRLRWSSVLLLGALALGFQKAGAMGLGQAFQDALDHDPEYAAAEAKFRASREAVPSARAALLPSVTLDGSYTAARYDRNVPRRDPDNPLQTELEEVRESQRSQEYGATIRQTLFDGEAWQRLDRAHAAVRRAGLEREKARQSLAVRVAERYLAVVVRARRVELARHEKEAYEARHAELRSRARKGLASRVEALQARARSQKARSELIAARNRLESARRTLERLVGHPVDNVSGLLAVDELPDVGGLLADGRERWVRKALDENLSIEIARAGVAMARESRAASRARFLPRLSAVGQYSRTNARDQTIGGMDRRVMVRLEVPLYEGGRNISGLRETDAQLAEARRKKDVARRKARLDVREHLGTLQSTRESVRALKASLDSAGAFLEAAEAAHAEDLRGIADVLDARAEVYSAKQELTDALHESVVSQVRFRQSLGANGKAILDEVASYLTEPG